MLPLTEILMLVLLPVLLAASAFFSASETALFSLSRHQRLQLSRSGTLAAVTVGRLLGETRDLLMTLLLGNMTVNVWYFVVSTVLLLRLRDNYDASAALVAVLSMAQLVTLILLGEVLPKLVAVRLALRLAQVGALPLMGVHRVLQPVRRVLGVFVIAPLARLIAPTARPAGLSAEELQTLLDLSKEHGVISHQEEQLLQQVLELGQLKVRDLMTPRVDIKAFDLSEPAAQLIELIRQTRLSHVPVYVDDLDHIEGVVFSRQALLPEVGSAADIRRIMRQVKFVPEQQRADQLLLELRKTGATFAIVVDEYGGTSGLITLEDVVEHMVGHIAGPYERDESPEVQPLGVGRWRVSAELSVREWADVFAAGWPVVRRHQEGVSTLGGLVMASLGRLPRIGDVVKLGNVLIEVEKMDRARVESLLVRLTDQSGADQPGGAPR